MLPSRSKSKAIVNPDRLQGKKKKKKKKKNLKEFLSFIDRRLLNRDSLWKSFPYQEVVEQKINVGKIDVGRAQTFY